MVQVFTTKKLTTSKSTAVVAYAVLSVLIYFKPEFRRFLIENGYKFPGRLSVRIPPDVHEEPEERMEEYQSKKDLSVVSLSDSLAACSKKDVRMLKLQIIYETILETLQPLNETVLLGDPVTVSGNQ